MAAQITYQDLPRDSLIPANTRQNISQTSSAPDCFIKQMFSQKLQAFLIGYVGNVYSNYSVYK